MIRHAVAIIAVMLPLVVPANAGGAAIVTILNIARGSPHTSAVWCSDGTTFHFDTQTGKLKG